MRKGKCLAAGGRETKGKQGGFSLEGDRFPQDGGPGRLGPGGDFRMGVPEGHDLPQIVRRPQDQHGHVAVGDAEPGNNLVPVTAAGPLVDYPGRPEIEVPGGETRLLQAPEEGPDRGGHAAAGLGQFPKAPAPVFHENFLIPVVNEGGDHGRHECRIIGEGLLFDTLADEEGLIEAQTGGPDPAFGKPVLLVYEALRPQEIQIPAEIVPEGGARFLRRAFPASGTLIGGQGIGEDLPDSLRRLGEEEIENHGKVVPKLTLDFFRFPEEEVPDMNRVHKPAGDDEEKTDLVQPPAAGPSRHLVEFRARQGTEFVPVKQIGVKQHDGSGGIVDPGGYGGGGEDGIEMPFLHHGFHQIFPGGQLTAVMGGHPAPFHNGELAMPLQERKPGQKIVQFVMEGIVVFPFGADAMAGLQRPVAFGAGFEKKYGRQELEGPQDLDDFPETGEGLVSFLPLLPLGLHIRGDPAVKTILFQKGEEPSRGVQKQGIERHGPFGGGDHLAGLPAQPGQPGGDLSGVADGGGQEQQIDPDGQVDHDLFPDYPPVAVSQVMGLVEDHQLAVQVLAPVHGVVELIAEDLRGAHDDRRVGIVLQVAGEDTHPVGAEELAEFRPFGVAQGLEGRGIPAPSSPLGDNADRLLGDPGLAGAGGGGNDAVPRPDRLQGVKLKGVGLKGSRSGAADAGEDVFQHRLRFGVHPGTVAEVGSYRAVVVGGGFFSGQMFLHDRFYHRCPC